MSVKAEAGTETLFTEVFMNFVLHHA